MHPHILLPARNKIIKMFIFLLLYPEAKNYIFFIYFFTLLAKNIYINFSILARVLKNNQHKRYDLDSSLRLEAL